VVGKPKFTRIPKVQDLVRQGVPAEAIPTYCALTDYANNKSGLCFPKMQTLAQTLNRSVRTIQRHLHLLKQLGLIEFLERRRNRGRFSSYLYRVLHIAQTTGHGRQPGSTRPIRSRTKRSVTPPYSPPQTDYEWLFGTKPDPQTEEEHRKQQQEKRKLDAQRRQEGYEWLFS